MDKNITSREEQNKFEAELLKKRILEVINNITDAEVLYRIYLTILEAYQREHGEVRK